VFTHCIKIKVSVKNLFDLFFIAQIQDIAEKQTRSEQIQNQKLVSLKLTGRFLVWLHDRQIILLKV
jgi:hypothetical protein